MTGVLVLCALVAAIAAPAALAADPVPADFKNAAKYCKAVRESKGVEGFQTAYGTNKNKKNAFGKCVSQTAKAKAAKREDAKKDDDDAAESKATADCKKQQAADAAKFAKDYKNFGQCVKAGNAKNGDDQDDD
jgi:Skp family chaperone for outer membrane proteins